MSGSVDVSDMLTVFGVNLLRYLIEGLAIAIAVALVSRKAAVHEIVTITLVALAALALLDFFTPQIAANMRAGTGLGLGFRISGALA